MGSIKSRPVYGKLQLDPQGTTQLIVTDLPAIPDDTIGNIETWTVAVAQPGIAAQATGPGRTFRAPADLLATLAHRLTREHAGFRLYAVGTEAFLWDVTNIARAHGLGGGEIFLSHAGSLRRRVYCTHCKTMNEDVTTNIVPCRACGAALFVRDHFSRRLAAFMGVKIDAEVPGEIPAIEVLYP
jgi:hypothetical protein